MAKTATLNIRTDPEVKANAENIYQSFGITLSDAVNIFLRKSIMYGGLPFEMRTPNAETLAAMDDVLNHRNLSGPFHSVEEMMEALDEDDA